MTNMRQGGQAPLVSDRGYGGEPEPTGWVAWILFAGIMMIISGIFSVIDGLIALLKDEYYLVGPEGLTIDIDYTAWGWTHLILGVLIGAAGVGVMAGVTVARVVGVILAGASAVVNFGFLASYPVWSTIVIAIDVFVIFALIVHGRETRGL